MGRDKHRGVTKNAINYKPHRSKYRENRQPTYQARSREQYDSSVNGCLMVLLLMGVLALVGLVFSS